MHKEYRLFPKIVAGVVALTGVSDQFPHDQPLQSVREKTSTEIKPTKQEKKDVHPEQDFVFSKEHPIEAELRLQHVPVERLRVVMNKASEQIRKERYGDAVNEKRYFSACYDTERFALIKKSIQYASEKTGVPERMLLGIGFIESGFQENAERTDTEVYGAMQMTLDTAKEVARDALEVFGFPIVITSKEDLKDVKTSIRLAALRIRSAQKLFGLSLATVDYECRRDVFMQKIKDAFPKIDFGEKDWKQMQQAHEDEQMYQKKRNEILEKLRRGMVSGSIRKELRQVVSQFEAAGESYREAKKRWKEKRERLSDTLQKAGVNLYSLSEHERKTKGGVSVSVLDALVLDDLAARAEQHYAKAILQKSQEKEPVVK